MDKKTVRAVLVVGSGVMGSSIALVFAKAGMAVKLVDVESRALHRAMGLIESGLNTLAELGEISRDVVPSILSRIMPSADLASMAVGADFIIEAVPEVPHVKKEVFSQLGEFCGTDAIIASNTSTLDVFSLAKIRGPERFVVAHFFAPAHIIPLVEVVPGAQTSPETVSLTVALMKRVGKSPVVMKKFGPGFIVNRLQKAISEAALELIEQDLAGPEEIDLAMKLTLGVRLPIVGVLQSLDFNGLDMILHAMRNSGKVYRLIEEKVNQGHLGAKTSKGIYDYQDRTEAEILKKRDALYLRMLEFLRGIHVFEPV